MKHKQRIIACAMSAALALSAVSLTGASAAPSDSEPVSGEWSGEAKAVKLHQFSMDKTKDVNCIFYKELPSMPYMDVEEYLELLFEKDYSTAEDGDHIYTITSPTGKMTVDTAKDVITFDCYEKFLDLGMNDRKEKEAYTDYSQTEFKGEVKGVTLDMYSKYNIQVTDDNGKVYLPLATMSDLFSPKYYCAKYANGEIYLIDTEKENYADEYADLDTAERDQSMADYTYNELCFVMDNMYGCPPKCAIAQKIADNGFDATMESNEEYKAVKKRLLSTNKAEYYAGLIMLDNLLGDGGHTSLSISVIQAAGGAPDTAVMKEFMALRESDEVVGGAVGNLFATIMDKDTLADDVKAQRDDVYKSYNCVKQWKYVPKKAGDDGEVIDSYYENGDTGIFVFDSFADEVVEHFHWSLENAKQHGVKRFVIDVSNNSGGSSDVVNYIMSVVSNVDYIDYSSSISGNVIRDTVHIDKNLDGKIDKADDDVKYDFQFAVLASRVSFSCGNLLPAIAKDNGIMVLGEHSGGGGCMVSTAMLPGGLSYAFSGICCLIDKNGALIDGGVEPDAVLVKENADGKTDFKQLYNIKTIGEKMDAFYAAAASSDSAKSESSCGSCGLPVWAIVLIIAGAVILVGAVVIIIIKKRKK